ncbi:MAG: glycosyltransferase family 2 protein, partial [Ginsengibacter sp.]
TDSTLSIARRYESLDGRIKVYQNERNLGDYPNRNKAASYAKGKYLKYVDSDDYIYPYGLEILVKSMEVYPGTGFGLCSLNPDDAKPFPFMLKPAEAYRYHFFGPGLFHKGPLDSIFVTSAFNSMGGFAFGRMISDTDMWHRMGLQFSTVLMPAGIVWQRRHHDQELTSQQEFIYEAEKIKWRYLKNPDCGFTIYQLKKIKRNRLKKYTGFIISGLLRFNFQQVNIYIACFWFVFKINIKKYNAGNGTLG